MKKFHVVDLFAGCGGLSFGFEERGFSVTGYEASPEACETYRKNLKGAIIEAKLTDESIIEAHDVLIGGPPCQPFSRGGTQKGKNDKRDMVPFFLETVTKHKPRIAIMENVENLAGKNHRDYFERLVSQLKDIGYQVSWEVLNFAHYGVPQTRKRLFVVAHLGGWKFPKKSTLDDPRNVSEILPKNAWNKNTAEEYPDLVLTKEMDKYIEAYEKKSHCKNPRDLHPEKPARTLTCRNLCGCTSDMIRIVLSDGRRRQLTVEEASLLQTFSSNYFSHQKRNKAMQQIGNAVPPLFSSLLAQCVLDYLLQYDALNTFSQKVVLKRKPNSVDDIHQAKKKSIALQFNQNY